MPEFTAPVFLTLLPLTVVVLLWQWRRRRPALRYSDLSLFDGLPRGRAPFVRWFMALWRSLAILMLILALAGPRWPDPESAVRLPTEGVALSMVLDISSSMATTDVRWAPDEPFISRLEAAKRSLRLFLIGGTGPDGTEFPGRPTDRAGLVTFAVWPNPVCPLTLAHPILIDILYEQQIADHLDEGSNVGDAIAQGVLQLQSAGEQRKVLILLSDGEHNFDLAEPRSPLKPRQAAQLAAAESIIIHAIDTGGEPIPPGDMADASARDAYEQRLAGREILDSVTRMTGGQVFSASDADGMRAALQQIDELERVEIKTFHYRHYHEQRPWLTFGVLVLLLCGCLVERVLCRVTP